MNIGERIKLSRSRLKMTQQQLGDKIGANKASISQWENGVYTPDAKNIAELAKALGVTVFWLIDGKGDPVGSNVVPASKSFLLVPLLDFVQAGLFCQGNWTPDGQDEDCVRYACPNPKAGPNTYALMVRGESMTNPFGSRSYPEGTIIFVDPDVPAKPGHRVIAALQDGKLTFKELAENEQGEKYLRALNQRYTISEYGEPVKICGVVIGSYMPE
ncbi:MULTISPECIES: LexA family protein [Aeromonas]|uniref:LexA family protein n=1 Tax=Aeromonas TaxID=642 RepID=UPI0022862E01|nr:MULTISPECIES: S24 family peptidase [Aeromonas]